MLNLSSCCCQALYNSCTRLQKQSPGIINCCAQKSSHWFLFFIYNCWWHWFSKHQSKDRPKRGKTTTSAGTQSMPHIDIKLWWAPSHGIGVRGGRLWTLLLNECNQISIAWELDDAPFFLLLFSLLESFPCLMAAPFAAAGACVASRCWWILANGSSWNCRLSSTALRWAASRSLDKKFRFRVQN